ncbi:MAG: MBL fold metallo-hydrolase [Coriobacteriales bacterium]|jgi:hydroxyacylglutathione hydrolase
MEIETVVVGPIRTNCYLVSDGEELVVVDPGAEVNRIIDALDGRAVKEIWVTHRHQDHIGALAALQDATGAPVAMSAVDAALIEGKQVADGVDVCQGHEPAAIQRKLSEGDEVTVGPCTFEVIETPGHTEGSICYYCAGEHVLFAGDTLFAGGRYGRTDLEGGSFSAIVDSMKNKLSKLPDETIVLSGHDQRSNMMAERQFNEYLRG